MPGGTEIPLASRLGQLSEFGSGTHRTAGAHPGRSVSHLLASGWLVSLASSCRPRAAWPVALTRGGAIAGLPVAGRATVALALVRGRIEAQRPANGQLQFSELDMLFRRGDPCYFAARRGVTLRGVRPCIVNSN